MSSADQGGLEIPYLHSYVFFIPLILPYGKISSKALLNKFREKRLSCRRFLFIGKYLLLRFVSFLILLYYLQIFFKFFDTIIQFIIYSKSYNFFAIVISYIPFFCSYYSFYVSSDFHVKNC